MEDAPSNDAKSSKWYRLDEMAGLTRADLINGGSGLIFGGIVGWAISKIADDPAQLELWVVVAISIIAFFVCLAVASFLGSFQAEGRDRLDLIDVHVATLLEKLGAVEQNVSGHIDEVQQIVSKGVDASAVLVPRESIYFEMAACIRAASKQVVVLTTFMYDWEADARTFDPVMQGVTPGLDDFYTAIYGCIEDPQVEYVRLWQVPADHVHDARAKIEEDYRLKHEIELIEAISPDDPHRCRMRIIPESTTASLILVDQETLFFNVDFYDADRGRWLSPFMLMIRDARGRAFRDMQRIITKLSTQA